MAEFFLTVFIFIGVMAVTALVFGGWVIVNVIRGLFGMFGVSRRPGPPLPQNRGGQPAWRPAPSGASLSFVNSIPTGVNQCGVPGCRQLNPTGARFCRRCGHAFPQHQHVGARRAAAV